MLKIQLCTCVPFKMMTRSSTYQTICKLNRRWKSTRIIERKSNSVEPVQQWQNSSVTEGETDENDIRKSIAPWIRIGKYEKGLLSHLSNSDLLRALFVLRICSFDSLVERSPKLFELASKLGPIGKWPIRKTFFDQFVGGEDIPRMTTVVTGLQNRSLRLMVAPVLEEDIGDEKSSKTTYDNNINSLLNLASMTASLEKNRPILQLKVSAITPPKTLDAVSRAIIRRCTDNQKLAKVVEDIASTIENPAAFPLDLGQEDQVYFIDGLRRADQLAKRAVELNLYITVDAEFYSCKQAISVVALALMARHNKTGYFIGNTIQAYLKDAVATINSELEVITKLIGVNWYGKVVRGAYMDKERQIAQTQGYSSPICDSYEDTNKSYNEVVKIILNQIRLAGTNNCPKPYLLVASHNEKSVRLAAQQMENWNLNREDGAISFAQIFGMGDYLSTPLVEQNYTVYKSTPYGPMEKVIPYLTRRALENRAVIQGAREERTMLKKELQHRLRLL